jgi:hypothetical protein
MLATSVAADPPRDFSGTWRTVTEESESMDPVLKAQGASWFARKAAGMLALEFVIRQNGIELEQDMESKLMSNTQKYQMNAPEYVDEDFKDEKIRARDFWTEDGQFTRRMEYDSGSVIFMHRTLRDDGRHIDVRFDVTLPGEPTTTVKRVLRRVDADPPS